MEDPSHRPETALISGHAKFPQESAAKAVYDILTLTVEVETRQWTVLSADATLVTSTARDFLKRKLQGRRLLADGQAIHDDLEISYWGGAKKAVLAAFKDLCLNTLEFSEFLGGRGLEKGRTLSSGNVTKLHTPDRPAV